MFVDQAATSVRVGWASSWTSSRTAASTSTSAYTTTAAARTPASTPLGPGLARRFSLHFGPDHTYYRIEYKQKGWLFCEYM